MIKVGMDEKVDAVYIDFGTGKFGYAEELDENRIVDYSANPGIPIGVSLHNVSKGVLIKDLPQPERVRSILIGLGVVVQQ